mgnify:CR=1 FL=1
MAKIFNYAWHSNNIQFIEFAKIKCFKQKYTSHILVMYSPHSNSYYNHVSMGLSGVSTQHHVIQWCVSTGGKWITNLE